MKNKFDDENDFQCCNKCDLPDTQAAKRWNCAGRAACTKPLLAAAAVNLVGI